jgi:hypothetical protein
MMVRVWAAAAHLLSGHLLSLASTWLQEARPLKPVCVR